MLLSGVQGITNLITTPGLINLDFADVKSVMSGAGSALMGIGSSRGEGRAVQAAGKAINSPLLEASMDGAQGVLLSIAGGSDLGLFEINEAASLVQEAAHPEANIIFGTVIDDSLGDEVRVTVIAAGFDSGGPTHKKLEPTAFGSAERTGDGGSGSAPASAPDPPQQSAPTSGQPAPSPSTAPPRSTGPAPSPAPSSGGGYSSGGYGSGFGAHPPAAHSGNGNTGHTASGAHQTGTLPPAVPGPAEQYPPSPRRPEHPQPGDGSAPGTAERSAPAYTRPAETHDDLDDDVDVPPFMKR